MKKLIFSVTILFLGFQNTKACAGEYMPDSDFFCLFTQELVRSKEYSPFLLTYESPFYTSKTYVASDDNIESWMVYFNNSLSYEETDALVKTINIKHFYNLKKGILSHNLFKKLGKDFYKNYKEGIDYLIEAKYLEPYMRFGEVTTYKNDDYDHPIILKSASYLDYTKNVAALNSLYKAAKNPEIKLRYAYQLVRFQHYTEHYKLAIQNFDTLVLPLKRDTPIYWYALDQKAGAQRGLKLYDDANWNFFQVFMHSRNRKEIAYNSMFLGKDDKNFESILKRAKTPEEKNMAYFLLAYDGFSNPVSIMEKMLANNANSDILKVLTARAINELERNYLPVYLDCDDDNCDKNLSRMPFYQNYNYFGEDVSKNNYLKELNNFVSKAKSQTDDIFWNLSEAYLKFLNRDYQSSLDILNKIKTDDVEFLAQINKMKMLNDIVSQEKITPEFEKRLFIQYRDLFTKEEAPQKNDWDIPYPTTKEFVLDILANRYFLQGDKAKSFLLNNTLSDIQYNPNFEMVKSLEEFYKKPNKNDFEKYMAKNLEDVGNPQAFFNVIYGDKAMKNGDFELAKSYYEKSKDFLKIPRFDGYGNDEGKVTDDEKNEYDGFRNISSLIFGHNVWESYGSKPEESMKADYTADFPFIKPNMNKFELIEALLQLKKLGDGNNTTAAKANQLIGNILYNTSILGYYRHIFVMDLNNYNGQKFQFWNFNNPPFHYYYKNYNSESFVDADNFDYAIQYYQKALNITDNKEQKARILFQMASAEQGKYYQWETENFKYIDWSDPEHEKKVEQRDRFLNQTKNEKYRNYFAELKKNYGDTKTAKDLQTSCLYYGYYSSK